MKNNIIKNTICIILTVCFMFSICFVDIIAKEKYTKYLQVSVNGKIETYECLWNGKEVFFSTKDLSKISNFDCAQINDKLQFEFFREFNRENGTYGIELQTSVYVDVNKDKKSAKIEAMNESYTVDCLVENDDVFLPLDKLLYLLHSTWTIQGDVLQINPMPFTILDFMAVHNIDLEEIASNSDDILINTGWLLSDNKTAQVIYSVIADVFNDFDGKIFLPWWPEEGHVLLAEGYEDAILQLAKNEKDFIDEDIQSDAMELVANTTFALNDDYLSNIQNIISVPGNIDDIVQSVPDAVSVIEDIKKYIPKVKVPKKLKTISENIKEGKIDTSFLQIPEIKSKVTELQGIGDGLAILQCVWNAYETADRVNDWDKEYLDQLQLLADYKNPGYINENILNYVKDTSQRLINSYENPSDAALNEGIQSALALILNTTFNESPFGKAFGIMGTIGTVCGTFSTKDTPTGDVYAALDKVIFSIKVEQLVKEMFRYENIANTTEKLTKRKIEEARNQLMLYLRLNLRNKVQLYNLNIEGNVDENWIDSQEGKQLYDEIVKVYAMLAELIQTKDNDECIIISKDLDDIYSTNPEIPEEILLNEKYITLSESELLTITETTAKHTMESYVYVDMDHNGTNELIGVYCDDKGLYQTWYCSSDGKICTLVHQNDDMMDACEIKLLDLGSETHVVLNTYRFAGTGKNFSIIALKNQEIICLISNEYGYVSMSSDGDIMLNVEAYDGMYDPVIGGLMLHTWKDTYLFFDGNTYKEYGATKISENIFLSYQNSQEIKNKIITELQQSDTTSLEFVYYKRKNGIIHIQCNVHSNLGEIKYGYYTVKYKDNELSIDLGEYNQGQMSSSFSNLEVIY